MRLGVVSASSSKASLLDMKKNNVFKEIAQGLVVTVVGFVLLEALLRIAYFGRDWMVTEIR